MRVRTLALLGLLASLSACASAGGARLAADFPTKTVLDHYAPQVTHGPDEILLASHDGGVSPNQAAALADLVSRWRDAGAQTLVIKAPDAGGDQTYRMVAAVQTRLDQLGVDPLAIEVVGYQHAPGAPSPVIVGFERYQAVVSHCNQGWSSFTRTNDNEVNPNFGCANNANLAAMIANPEDLAHPAATTAPDATRRESVLTNYRKGAVTSTPADPQASVELSQ